MVSVTRRRLRQLLVEQGVCGLYFCNQHFNVVRKQIVNTINACSAGHQRAQMNAMLQHRKEEFYRENERASLIDEDEWQNILVAFQILEDDFKRDEIDIIPIPEQQRDEIDIVPEQQKECPICLEQFSPKNMTFLECAHALCNGCLRNLERHNVAQRCPVCRYNI